ncbi:MAG TPA: F0F1 ATP synthase subunit epsilon [Burkholderiales bacterium]|nr:F0F1 ATP synthase subunit epsilon [Burkholderiales bacterium]
MTTYTLTLHGATQRERIANVTRFVGEDESGQFCVLAHHARLITVLVYGVARYCVGNDDWRYIALPGAVLRFAGNEMHIAARRYIQGPNFDAICRALSEQLMDEEKRLRSFKENLNNLEQQMLRKLWQMER